MPISMGVKSRAGASRPRALWRDRWPGNTVYVDPAIKRSSRTMPPVPACNQSIAPCHRDRNRAYTIAFIVFPNS